MKKKFFYLLLVVCCLSMFSSARQAGRFCSKTICCPEKKESGKSSGFRAAESARDKELELAPFNLLDI